MVQACILVRAESKPGSSSINRFINILDEIKKVENVESAFIVYGRYDLVVFVEASSFEEVKMMRPSLYFWSVSLQT